MPWLLLFQAAIARSLLLGCPTSQCLIQTTRRSISFASKAHREQVVLQDSPFRAAEKHQAVFRSLSSPQTCDSSSNNSISLDSHSVDWYCPVSRFLSVLSLKPLTIPGTHLELRTDSLCRPLLEGDVELTDISEKLWEAPFALLVHDLPEENTTEEAIYSYANKVLLYYYPALYFYSTPCLNPIVMPLTFPTLLENASCNSMPSSLSAIVNMEIFLPRRQ